MKSTTQNKLAALAADLSEADIRTHVIAYRSILEGDVSANEKRVFKEMLDIFTRELGMRVALTEKPRPEPGAGE